MEIKIDILQVAKCIAAEQREKDERARIELEKHNSKYIQEAEKIRTTILDAVNSLHGAPTPRGRIDVLVDDRKDTLCLIYVGNQKFCRINVECLVDPLVTGRYNGILHSATIWDPDSKCDVHCAIPGWYSLSHQDDCKVKCFSYRKVEEVNYLLETVAHSLAKWL